VRIIRDHLQRKPSPAPVPRPNPSGGTLRLETLARLRRFGESTSRDMADEWQGKRNEDTILPHMDL
jgi:hypothetical protein